MELTVQNVYGLLIRSKLLELDDCRKMFADWNAEAKDAAGNVAHFAKWTVAKGYLTEYQASLLARGHADGFYLNQYRILDRLGKGRMAGVYKARHDTGSVVAIKVLPPSKARDASLLARFQREARVAVKLRHPNIVRTFDVGEAIQASTGEKLHYLVMEFVDGEPLDEVLQRRKQLPPPEAVRLVYQAFLGLQHIHEQGLVHRDLKPANLMIAYGPGAGVAENTLKATVKILDMGLARALSDEIDSDRPDAPQLTAEGVVLGTPDYMAPEQARDARTADVRADIYSLGCVLYHLLAGSPPFPDSSFISQMIRHATEQAKPLKDFNPAVSDGLQQIVNFLMAKEPGQRYPTPDRAAQALKVFLAAGGDASASLEGDPKMKKYLTWLEVEGNETAKKSASPAATTSPPAATPATSSEGDLRHRSVPIAQAAPGGQGPVPVARALTPGKHKTKSAAKRRGKKGKKSRTAMHLPVAQSAASGGGQPVQVFDVELVAVPPTPPPVRGLTRRDLAMFGVGVGTVILAGGLGLLGAWLFGAFDR